MATHNRQTSRDSKALLNSGEAQLLKKISKKVNLVVQKGLMTFWRI